MPIKSTTLVETTVTHEFASHEFSAWLKEKDLIPKDWHGWSLTVEGLGVSKGANIVLKNIAAK